MNAELRRLVQQHGIDGAAQRQQVLRFGHACVARVEHLLEEEDALRAWRQFGAYLEGQLDAAQFEQAAAEVLVVANRHRGSKSIDGSQHAAVSATYALANAVNGKPVDAAEYAAYSKIYAYGGYAVRDPASFEDEYAWQCATFRTIFDSPVAPQA